MRAGGRPPGPAETHPDVRAPPATPCPSPPAAPGSQPTAGPGWEQGCRGEQPPGELPPGEHHSCSSQPPWGGTRSIAPRNCCASPSAFLGAGGVTAGLRDSGRCSSTWKVFYLVCQQDRAAPLTEPLWVKGSHLAWPGDGHGRGGTRGPWRGSAPPGSWGAAGSAPLWGRAGKPPTRSRQPPHPCGNSSGPASQQGPGPLPFGAPSLLPQAAAQCCNPLLTRESGKPCERRGVLGIHPTSQQR